MFELAGYECLDRIHLGRHAEVYLGRIVGTADRCAIKISRGGADSLRNLAMLRLEHDLCKELAIEGVARPLAFVARGGQAAFVMEYAGVSLAERLARPGDRMPLAEALRIALGAADVVGRIHEADIVHKDVNPNNILVDDNDRVTIIDFSIATRLAGERAVAGDVAGLEGTLAYIAPEQTGRMNRSIDFRSDYYALGATLYHLVTGRPPFDLAAPIELVHAHMAKSAPAPHTLADVPESVSAVIMKLLAKNAEDRYQSNHRLRADLEECLGAVESGRSLAGFVPARDDRPDRLQISQKLYGRERELSALLAAFERASSPASTASELVLVAGYSGIGKSSIVQEIHKPIAGKRGYFVAGKFDQFNRNIPYASLILAFQELVQHLLMESEQALETWRERLQRALGPNGQVVVDVIPEVELIIGKQAPLPALGPTETRNRFNLSFRAFTQVFARADRPLVLFLDDLQWADSASLNLLHLILVDSELKNLLIIGAYRDNEVDATHPLMVMLNELGPSRGHLTTLQLSPLDAESVTQLVADTLVEDRERVRPLSDLLARKTLGNPFFLIQLLSDIHRQKLLFFEGRSGRWQWDLPALERQGITDNVVELMIGKLSDLDAPAQEAIKLSSCIGNTFDLETLAVLAGRTPHEVAKALWGTLLTGLVVPLSSAYKLSQLQDFDPAQVRYAFLHDRVQDAAHELLSVRDQARIHLELARLLLKKTAEGALDEHIFDVVAHLNLGASDVKGAEERLQAARLNLRATRKGRASTAYEPAIACARAGIAFLPEDAWQVDYRLALDLYSELAELEYLTIHFDRAEAAAQVVIEHAHNVLEKIRVYETRIQFYVSQNRMLLAIETVKEVLSLLGVSLVDAPPAGLERTPDGAPRDIAALIELPPMVDPVSLAAMRILMTSMPAVYIAAPQLLPAVAFTMVQLTLEHGNSSFAAYGYSLYGLILCGVLGQIEKGDRFSELAMRLLERYEAKELESKVYALVFIFVRHWRRHVRETLDGLYHGVQVGLETGDIEYAGYNNIHYASYYFFVGDDLESAAQRLRSYLELSEKLEQEYQVYYNRIWLQLVLGLKDPSARKDKLLGESFDEVAMSERLGAMRPSWFSMHQARAMLQYYFGDARGAYRSTLKAEEFADGVAGFVSVVQHNFYQSLAICGCWSDLSEAERAEAEQKLEGNQAKLRTWADHAPENDEHKFDLVAAERARVSGAPAALTRAMALYGRAIAGARKTGYVQEEALANELCAAFYRGLGAEESARHHLSAAYLGYQRWGAEAKCAALRARHPELGAQDSPLPQLGSTRTTSDAGGALDLASVVKSSQALTSEIQLEKLIQKLMIILLENVGAERGVLVLARDHGLFVEAEATAGDAAGRVLEPELVEASARVPRSVVTYVERTQSPVVIRDAANEPRYAGDPYVEQTQPRSVLCAPILHKAKLLGVLYFENNLAAGVFTAERLEMLRLLSAQVAISIENSRLYARLEEYSRTLEHKVEERTHELTQRNLQLSTSLDRIREMQEQIITQEKLASLGTLTAGIAHEIRNPLNFINNFSDLSVGLVDELREELEPEQDKLGPACWGALEEITSNLAHNVRKITEHGHRIDSITKAMLSLSRGVVTTERTTLNELVAEHVGLAYHGMRALNGTVQVKLQTQLDPAIGVVSVVPQNLGRVILNLCSNAFYAVSKRAQESNVAGYSPEVTVSTTDRGESFDLVVRDNGTGIPKEVMSQLFNPFFTTKPAGQGTGLGLSICHDIVVRQHQGSLSVDSQPGEWTQFVITLPKVRPADA
jgi:predicted ATPase/signal transduction histidine kinase/tRNA A-37 threonylcarbamoyl transferase component Bud32